MGQDQLWAFPAPASYFLSWKTAQFPGKSQPKQAGIWEFLHGLWERVFHSRAGLRKETSSILGINAHPIHCSVPQALIQFPVKAMIPLKASSQEGPSSCQVAYRRGLKVEEWQGGGRSQMTLQLGMSRPGKQVWEIHLLSLLLCFGNQNLCVG